MISESLRSRRKHKAKVSNHRNRVVVEIVDILSNCLYKVGPSVNPSISCRMYGFRSESSPSMNESPGTFDSVCRPCVFDHTSSVQGPCCSENEVHNA